MTRVPRPILAGAEAQGFLFSPPVPAPDVPEMLARINAMAAVPALFAPIDSLAEAAA